MFYYCTVCPHLFILRMILCLDVQNNNDNVQANVTLVTNTHTHVAFHKALQRYASRQIDDFDVVLFQIYLSMPIIISLQNV